MSYKRCSNGSNQILPRLSLMVCLIIIFPLIQSYSVPKDIKAAPYPPICVTIIQENDFYVIECQYVNEKNLTSMIENEVENFPNGKKTIDHLTIRNLISDNRKLNQNWINTTTFRITTLFLNDPNIDRVENNAFKGYAFEELDLLRFGDVTTDILEEGTFEGLHQLSQLEIYRCAIKHIDENALKVIAPNLVRLTFMEMIHPLNVTNLTGSVPLPKIDLIRFGFANTSFDSGSFTQAGNARYGYFYYNRNFQIGCGTFENMPSLELLYLNNNRFTTLDPCILGDEAISNLRDNSLSIDGNEWNCNCDLDWLKQLKVQNKIFGDAKCASHSNLPFEDVTFCNEET